MRAGAALPAVLLSLAFTSALAVGGAYVARQHARMALIGHHGMELMPAAEERLADVIVIWDTAAMNAQPVGVTAELPFEGASSKVWVTRTGQAHFWVVAEVASGDGPALNRRIGLILTTSSGVPRPVSGRSWAELP